MRRAMGAAVMLLILGWAAVGFPAAGIPQPHGAPTEVWGQASRLTALALVSMGREAGYPCLSIGTEGPPERDMPESKGFSGPAVGAPVRSA